MKKETYNTQIESITENLINWGAYGDSKAAILSSLLNIASYRLSLDQAQKDVIKLLEEQAAHPDFPEAKECLPEWKKNLKRLVEVIILTDV